MKMKIFLLLVFALLSIQEQCNQHGELPFIIATSQSWSGGAAAMHGTYYNVYFKMKPSADLVFDSLWVDHKRFEITIFRYEQGVDSIRIFVNDKTGPRNPIDQSEPDMPTQINFPISTDAEALLGYHLKGSRMFFPIQKFARLKPLAYP